MIRIETGGITSFVEALQASMSETLDHTSPLSRVNVGCQLTLVNLYGQKDMPGVCNRHIRRCFKSVDLLPYLSGEDKPHDGGTR